VDEIHGPHLHLDPGWLYEDHRLRRYPGRRTEDCLPHTGHHHGREAGSPVWTRRGPGSRSSQTRSCSCCLAIPITWQQATRSNAPKRPSHSSSAELLVNERSLKHQLTTRRGPIFPVLMAAGLQVRAGQAAGFRQRQALEIRHYFAGFEAAMRMARTLSFRTFGRCARFCA